MKKIVFTIKIGIPILLFFSCKSSTSTSSTKVDTTNVNAKTTTTSGISQTQFPPNTYSLNGIPLSGADGMVRSFLGQKGSYDKAHPTCVWFSKDALQAMLTLLNQNGNSDGMRFYYARTLPSGDYTIVIMPTTNDGPDTTDPTPAPNQRNKHKDYPLTALPVLASSTNISTLYGQIGNVTPGKGAKLYRSTSPCGTASLCSNASIHYISCEDAYNMVSNIGGDEMNVTSEWFDKGVIQSLLNAITDPNGGIRVYYARHLKAYDPVDTVTKMHGFVLITTAPNLFGTQIDQYVCINVAPFAKYIKSKVKLTGGGTDNGEECPTNCSGTTWPPK